MTCAQCGTDHDGYPDGSLGAEMRCLRKRAEDVGAIHVVDQVDAAQRNMDEHRDAFVRAFLAS